MGTTHGKKNTFSTTKFQIPRLGTRCAALQHHVKSQKTASGPASFAPEIIGRWLRKNLESCASMVILAILSISLTFAGCIFLVFAAYQIFNDSKKIRSHADRIRASVTRLCAIIVSYLGVQVSVAIAPGYFFFAGNVAAGATAKVAASLLASLALGLGDNVVEQMHASAQVSVTATSQQELTLKDGTRLTLSADAAINVQIDDVLRGVVLDHGEVRFKVARDPERPFLVQTPHATVRVLGTEFTVNSAEQGTNVLVHEGRVEVLHRGLVQLVKPGPTVQKSASSSAGMEILLAGGNTFVRADGKIHNEIVVEGGDLVPSSTTAPRIRFNDELLSNVVAEINRHQDKPFILVDQEIGAHPITGMFDPSDRQTVIDVLKALGIRVEEDSEGRALLYKAKTSSRKAGALPH
jgi:transmembrane sensor